MKLYKNFPIVEAHVVNLNNIIFKCPFHKKKTFHYHGSCGDLTNRRTHRGSHCPSKELKQGYYLEINQKTTRAYLGSINQILKRDQQLLNQLWIQQQNIKGTYDIIEN